MTVKWGFGPNHFSELTPPHPCSESDSHSAHSGKIPVTPVECSSVLSPICYWISMLVHGKTISHRKGLDLVSKA